MRAKFCPVCGSGSIHLTLRDLLLSAHVDGLTCRSSGAFAYHCDTGHIFLLLSEDFRSQQPVPEGKGYSILV
jgi:hypothetical protein